MIRHAKILLLAPILGFAALRPACAASDPDAFRAAVLADWLKQDAGAAAERCFKDAAGAAVEIPALENVLKELGGADVELRAELKAMVAAGRPGADPAWKALYMRAAEARRGRRLAGRIPARVVFTKHFNMGGSHYAYTEAQSDAQAERHFVPGTALCVLETDGLYGRVRTLIDDPGGVIRDPDVSYDGRRILFAWKKSDRQDDYHLYELDASTGAIRQLTSGLGFADYEGAYLPGGDLVFNSTRCVQTVDCWWTEVSNLYTCDGDGRYLRRLAFDQVHDNYPAVLDDGRVIYTRWEYSDRGQVYVQGLFQMNADGTAQTEFYGNNSWFPTTILHARGIPGTRKVMAILTGHHSRQKGKLAIIDPDRGRQENSGVQLVAPVRETKAVKVDAYGQDGEQFQYPYPLGEDDALVTYSPEGGAVPLFALYHMTIDGRRELLAADPAVSCNQPVPLRPRPVPHVRPSLVDYRNTNGIYYMQDVYAGPGLSGIPRGAAKRLRVVQITHRAAGMGSNGNGGEAGGALICTPPSIGNGAWDPKVVLGEADIHGDGSAMFEVPARMPVYFQVLDATNRVIQTMRSWSTLQPGETFSCVGCHEPKSAAPVLDSKATMAQHAGVQKLQPFYGPPRGFSFAAEIQPILDRHCIRCHHDRETAPRGARAAQASAPAASNGVLRAFSLRGDTTVDEGAKRRWSDAYLALTGAVMDDRKRRNAYRGNPEGPVVTWISAQSRPPMLPPYFAGSAKSLLPAMLEKGHNSTTLSREEMDKLACWIDLLVPYCGDYVEAHAWSMEEAARYEHFLRKRRTMEEIERTNIGEFLTRENEKGPQTSGDKVAWHEDNGR